MSGNICRCAAYPNIVAAIVGGGSAHMKAFTYYERANSLAQADNRPRPSPRAKNHRGGNEPARLDEAAN